MHPSQRASLKNAILWVIMTITLVAAVTLFKLRFVSEVRESA